MRLFLNCFGSRMATSKEDNLNRDRDRLQKYWANIYHKAFVIVNFAITLINVTDPICASNKD